MIVLNKTRLFWFGFFNFFDCDSKFEINMEHLRILKQWGTISVKSLNQHLDSNSD